MSETEFARAERYWRENCRLRDALKEIEGHIDQTNLGECCVLKTCQAVYDDGEKVAHCAFQYGVNRGFNELGYIARRALSETGSQPVKK